MRKLVYVLIGCTVLLMTGYAGYRGYKVWRQSHMMTLAEKFLAKSDAKNAFLCLNRVLRSNPRHVGACRMLANLTEAARSPSALLWRSRVVDLNPRSTDDRLALARTAITMRDLITATNALDGVTQAGKETAAYHSTAGVVSLSLGHIPESEAHFREAARLEPTNVVPRLNLAVIQLRNTNALISAEARNVLRELSTHAVYGPQSLRELVADAVGHRQTNEALQLAQRLTQNTNAAFSDRIVRLELLRSAQNPEYQPYLTSLRSEAQTQPGKIQELASWQMMTMGPANTLTWFNALSAEMKTNQVVMLLSAQCRAALQDWRALIVGAEQQNWAELEFIRHSYMARAMRGLDLASSAKTEWEQALKLAKSRKESLVMLLRMSMEWNWPNEQEQLLWALVNQFPGENWAKAGLTQVLMSRGRTQGLLTLFTQLARANPNDLAIKNNLAITALLLGADQVKPHELAREVYEKAPTNSSYASTYAYSLYRQEKRKEALKIIEQLTPEELEKPSIAAYYGVLLQADGNRPKARKYLEISGKARLLPEEQRLVDQARAGG